MKNRKYKLRIIKITAGILFLLTAILAPVIFFENTAAPGTVVLGTDFSYKREKEIRNTIYEKTTEFIKTPQRIVLNGSVHEVFPEEIGFSLDIEETLDKIQYINLNENGTANVLNGIFGVEEIKPYMEINEKLLIQKLEADLGEKSIQNAGIEMGPDGKIRVTENKNGITINKEKLLMDVYSNFLNLEQNPVIIETFEDSPDVTTSDIQNLLEQILIKIKRIKTLQFEKQEFKFNPQEHIEWISFTKEQDIGIDQVISGEKGERDIKITLKREPLVEFIKNVMIQGVEKPAEDVKIFKNQDGTISFEGTATDGREIQKENLIQMLEMAINEEVDSIDIPTRKIKGRAEVAEDLQNMGIMELIGIGHTTFYGSTANRIHNIKTGIQKYNGLIIPPGETFSFNEHLGRVEAITGFLQELTIKPEGTLPEYGGGLCQVSTTLYRAALLTGLPIVEREPHSYAVSYYTQILGYGLDATIYPGVHDVKFLNDTKTHILIQAYTDGMNAYYKFYGTKDGRKVSLEGPYISNYVKPPEEPLKIESDELLPEEEKQTEKPHTGFDVMWYRHIEYPDGTLKREEVFTRYKAIPEKIMVGKSKTEENTEKTSKTP